MDLTRDPEGLVCPLCRSHLESRPNEPKPDYYDYECPSCGSFSIDGSGVATGLASEGISVAGDSRISHPVRRLQGGRRRAFVPATRVREIQTNTTLPSVGEQAENLLLLIGDGSRGEAGRSVSVGDPAATAIIGAAGSDGLFFVIAGLEERGFVKSTASFKEGRSLQLTFDGWDRYEALRRGRSESRRAFMAMPYGDPELDRVVATCFQPAVAEAGFRLVRLDEVSRAGLIDDHLRVEIRRSRFLITDLTNGNQGAYWEAGFAEGLGKPVIYTCKASVFSEVRHFDAEHLWTLLWDPDDLADAARRLTAGIRETFPDEAVDGDRVE